MHVQSTPDTMEKLAIVGGLNDYERAGDQPQSESRESRSNPSTDPRTSSLMSCIAHVSTPKGQKAVMKAMVTTACEKDCYYCPFRAGRSQMKRLNFRPDELARAFDTMQRAKLVDGIFLSSGIIKGGVTTQDKIIDTIEIIRRKYQYQGYIHLKIMPGAEYDQVKRAMQLADRISINLEGPTPERLERLAPNKDFSAELLERLRWSQQIRQQMRVRASTVTQFVVGAVGDTDLELLSTSEQLYQQMGLKRAYYSAFSPVLNTPLENVAPTPTMREFRLYQSSFLLRDYGWDVEELPFTGEGNLRLDIDPKIAYAEQILRDAPVDLMRANRAELLRVPGIGPTGADAILKARGRGRLSDLSQLRSIGVRAPERAAPYILFDGHRPPHQLSLITPE